MKIGDKIKFSPTIAEKNQNATGRPPLAPKVWGTIVGIHRGHRFYRVRYELAGHTFYECFKFIPEGNEDIEPEQRTRWNMKQN